MSFLKPTKGKIIFVIIIAIAIFASLGLSENGIRCIKAPCGPTGSKVAQYIYSITTLDLKWIDPSLSYLNTAPMVSLKNLLRDSFGFSAGTTYNLVALIFGLFFYYLLACVVAYLYTRAKTQSVT